MSNKTTHNRTRYQNVKVYKYRGVWIKLKTQDSLWTFNLEVELEDIKLQLVTSRLLGLPIEYCISSNTPRSLDRYVMSFHSPSCLIYHLTIGQTSYKIIKGQITTKYGEVKMSL